MGLFYPFIDDPGVQLIGVEAAGDGVETGRHAASISGGMVGVLHGKKTYVLQDELGQMREAHSISAGLDYPGVGPEHALSARHRPGALRRRHRRGGDGGAAAPDRDRGHHPGARDRRTRSPQALELAPTMGRDQIIVVNLSGRGDKDMNTVAAYLGVTL